MKPQVILALDQGTTSSRTLAFNHEGEIVASAQREFAQHYPQPGWVEHDPEEIWQSQRTTLLEVLAQIEAKGFGAAAIGIANQRETTIVWDRQSGQAIHPAIVWQDRRTAYLCETLKKDGHEVSFRVRTGLRLDPYFSGTKIRWILDHVEGARERARAGELCFGTVDSWLLWKLTEGRLHATDATNASRTLLYDINKGCWDRELGKILEIPYQMLPELLDSSGQFAEWQGIPIAGIAGDQQAALFGQGCYQAGDAKTTYGTGCFLLMNTGDEPIYSDQGLLATVAWQLNGQRTYALEGSVFMGGAILNWLRDGLAIIEDAAEVEPLALQCDDTSGVVLVPAFTGLGAPHWAPEARAALLGMTRGTGKAEVARAALESIAFQCGEVLSAMSLDSDVALTNVRVDGGAARGDLLMQIQADLVGARVDRPACLETTALGAAALAGLATGFWNSRDELVRNHSLERSFHPATQDSDVRWSRWQKAVELVKTF